MGAFVQNVEKYTVANSETDYAVAKTILIVITVYFQARAN